MVLPREKTWVGLTTLALVLWLVTLDLEKTTPGPLSPVHAREARLTSEGGCAACHGAQDEDMADACLVCHAAIAADLTEATGLHGTSSEVPPRACGRCHLEHNGAEIPPIAARSFALAGVPDRATFDHARVGHLLAGAHADLACSACHAEAEALVLARGAQRYGGLESACASCHEDPHQGRMARACDDCHGQVGAFADLTAFSHDPRFPLIEGHAHRACVDCHAPGGPNELEAVAGDAPPPARRCGDCHESPHSASFLEGLAARVGVADPRGCAACHGSDGWTSDDVTVSVEQHAASGFPLSEPHHTLTCLECHAPGDAFAIRYPGREATDCAACHDQPHGAPSAGGPFSSGCLDCHAPQSFLPCDFGPAEHARTSFPLEGAHAAAACRACHGEALEVLHGTPSRCDACHTDAHRGDLSRAGDCATCHGTDAFDDCPDFDHGRWTGFELSGAHRVAACEACHPRAALPDDAGRTLGFVRDHFPGEPAACSGCHADPHSGVFADEVDDCARCHDDAAFSPARVFDHARTGFDLTGAHAQTACAGCHPSLSSPTADGRGYARAPRQFGDPGCADCHADPHQGSFEAGCVDCHDTVSFRRLAQDFDHTRWTGFALEGAHATTDCSACHLADLVADATGRTYQRAPGTACADCHVDPHRGQFLGANQATDCGRCHGSMDTWSAQRFDHGGARFALDETHAALDCAACHRPQPLALPDGGRTVRYRPLGSSCRDCHGFEQGGAR